MKKFLSLLSLLFCVGANAQFTPGQILTAQELNAAFAAVAPAPGITCLGSSFALNYSLGTGLFSCNGTINALTLSGATFQAPGPIGSVSPSTGAFTNLTASGTIAFPNGTFTLPSLAVQAANTLVANATSGSASPTAIAIPSCSTSSSALQYVSSSALACNTAINASTLGGVAAASYLTASAASSTYAALTGATFTGAVVVGGNLTVNYPTNTAELATYNDTAGEVVIEAVQNGTPSTKYSLNLGKYGGTVKVGSGGLAVSGNLTATGITNSPISGSSGSFTTLVASGGISGAGFNSLFASPSNIGTVAPAVGDFTTLAASSTITPSQTAGIVGTTTNNNANAGSIGEYATNTTSSTSLSTTIPGNCTSITLTAGDWDVQGVVNFVPVASTTTSTLQVSISTVSATNGSFGSLASSNYAGAAGVGEQIATPSVRILLASSVPVYLVGTAAFAVSTLTCNGFIRARRVR